MKSKLLILLLIVLVILSVCLIDMVSSISVILRRQDELHTLLGDNVSCLLRVL